MPDRYILSIPGPGADNQLVSFPNALGVEHDQTNNVLMFVTPGGTQYNLSLSDLGNFPSIKSTITLGTPTGKTQTATIQLTDAEGNNLAGIRYVEVYMCTDTAGATPSAAGVFNTVTVSTGSLLNTITAKLKFELLTNATGQIVLTFDNTGGGAPYTDHVVAIMANEGIIVSSALAVSN